MQALNVVIAQGDCVVAQSLAASLHAFFQNISVARSSEELRQLLARQRPDVAVVDLETVDMGEVCRLCSDFALPVVTMHRIPDEKMWTSALSAGASDCCDYRDLRNVVDAIGRSVQRKHSSARAA